MEQILDLPVTTEHKLNYAGFWIRVVAMAIDIIVIYAAGFLMAMVYAFAGTPDSAPDPESSMFVGLTFGLGVLAYFVLMESSEKQGTLGKMALGLKVGDTKGNRISILNALGRNVARLLSGMIMYIGYMMAGWDSKKQTLHDKVAETYVYRR